MVHSKSLQYISLPSGWESHSYSKENIKNFLAVKYTCMAYSGAANCKNTSNNDASKRPGKNTHLRLLFMQKSKMATIFQDGCLLWSKFVPNGLKPLNFAQIFNKRTHLLEVSTVVNIVFSSDDLYMGKIQDGVQDGCRKI